MFNRVNQQNMKSINMSREHAFQIWRMINLFQKRFAKFIQTQKRNPSSLDKISILT